MGWREPQQTWVGMFVKLRLPRADVRGLSAFAATARISPSLLNVILTVWLPSPRATPTTAYRRGVYDIQCSSCPRRHMNIRTNWRMTGWQLVLPLIQRNVMVPTLNSSSHLPATTAPFSTFACRWRATHGWAMWEAYKTFPHHLQWLSISGEVTCLWKEGQEG